MAVYVDIIGESSLELSRDGAKKWKLYKVTGLTPGETMETLAAFTAGIPQMYTPWAGNPLMTVSSIQSKAVSIDTAEVKVTFSTVNTPPGGNPNDPTQPVYRGSASVVEAQTNSDINGVQIAVSYTPTGGSALTAYPTVSVRRPHVTQNITRVEVGIDPLQTAKQYVGNVSSAAWPPVKANSGQTPDPAGMWLCTAIEWDTQDGGQTWVMNYHFEYQPNPPYSGSTKRTISWDPIVVYQDPATGQTPTDPVPSASNGIKEVTAYQSADFNVLKLM